MEISNQVVSNGNSVRDNKVDLRSGQVVSATVKERISENEAIISVRGQDIRAVFDGKVSDNDRILVEVKNVTTDGVAVKVIDENSGRAAGKSGIDNEIAQIVKSIGERLTPELRDALRLVAEAGTPITKELINEVKMFLNTKVDATNYDNPKQAEQLNSINNKLETLQLAVNKNIEVSTVHLQAIHEVLHGKAINEVINNLQSEFIAIQKEMGLTSKESYLNNELIQTLGNLKTKDFLISVVTKKLAEVGNEFRDFRKEITKNLDNLTRLVENNTRNTSQLALKMVEPTIKMLDKLLLKSDVLLFTDMKTEKTLMKASADMATAKNLLESGNRSEALQIIKQVQDTIGKLNWQPSSDRIQRFVVESQHKMEFMRQPIQEQLSQAVNNYSLKVDSDMSGRDVFNFLRTLGINHESEAAQRLVTLLNNGNTANVNTTTNTSASTQFVPNSTIQQLTPEQRTAFETILTRLVSEFQTQSNQVTPNQTTPNQTTPNQINANNTLSQAQQVTNQTVNQIQQQAIFQLLDKLVVSIKNNEGSQAIMQQLQQLFHSDNQNIRNSFSNEQLQKFEQLSKLFDKATWDRLEILDRQQQQQFNSNFSNNQNLKASLLEMLKHNQFGKNPQLEQTLTQLTGQQLLNKFDANSNLQSMLLSLPVIFKEQVEHLKVFVNGKSKSDTIDWENCSIYFLLETKRIGTTGIQITATNRNISVTVKNDRQGIKRLFDPFTDKFIDKLDEIGYKTTGIKFAPLTEPKVDTIPKQKNTIATDKSVSENNRNRHDAHYSHKKGFDFKI